MIIFFAPGTQRARRETGGHSMIMAVESQRSIRSVGDIRAILIDLLRHFALPRWLPIVVMLRLTFVANSFILCPQVNIAQLLSREVEGPAL